MMQIIEHNLNEELAIRILGWKWMSFFDTPVKGTEGYPVKCRVRQLFTVEQLKSDDWQKFLQENDCAEATGNEPLAYTYCSNCRRYKSPPRFIILMDDR